MSGWIKLSRGMVVESLLRKPNEFTLLAVIATRACREDSPILGLKKGQAMIGDYRNYGMSRQQYRTALSNLQSNQLITITSTTKGTIATLIDTGIFDINKVEGKPKHNQPSTTNPTPEQPLTRSKKNNKEKEEEEITNVPFEEFWDLYDKKEDRKKALAKWQKLDDSTRELIIERLPAYIESTPDKRFRKLPVTYLNGECWENEIIPPAGQTLRKIEFVR